MVKFKIPIIKFVPAEFVNTINWSITYALRSVFVILETWSNCISEDNTPSASIDMADLEEIFPDYNTIVSENKHNNDVFDINAYDLKIPIQQVDEQLFFDYFPERVENPNKSPSCCFGKTTAILSNENSNGLEIGRRHLWNTMDELSADKENEKECVIHSFKSNLNNTIEDHMTTLNANGFYEAVNSQRLSNNIKGTEKNNKSKWPLMYVDNFDKITSIKKVDNSENLLSTLQDVNKTESGDVLSTQQTELNYREVNNKDILISNDNTSTSNPVSTDIINDLEQQYITSDIKNESISILESQMLRNGNNDNINKVDLALDMFSYLEHQHMETSNMKNICFSALVIRENEINKNNNTNKLNSASIDIINDLKKQYIPANIENVGLSFLKTQTREANNKDNASKFNAEYTDITFDLEQHTLSNVEDVCFSFLPLQIHKVNKNDKKEKLKNYPQKESKNENLTDLIVFSENSKQNIHIDSLENQKILKNETNIQGNEFLSDPFIKTDIINDRRQMENRRQANDGKYNMHNKYSQISSIKEEKFDSKMNDQNGIPSCLTSEEYSENILLKLESEHEIHSKSKISKKFPNSYNNVPLNLGSKAELVEGEKYRTISFDEMKSSATMDLITWEIPHKKSNSQVNQKESEEISGKCNQKKINLSSKVHETMTCPSNISPEDESEHVEHTNNLKSKESLSSCDCNSINLLNSELLIECEKYQINLSDEVKSSAARNLISWAISDENSESKVNQKDCNESPRKYMPNKINLSEKVHGNIEQDESDNRINTKSNKKLLCETENKVNAKHLTENMKLPSFESSCKNSLLNTPTDNNPIHQIDCLLQENKLNCKKIPSQETDRRIVEQRIRKEEDHKEMKKQPDSPRLTNNLKVLNTEQISYGKSVLVASEAEKIMHLNDFKKDNNSESNLTTVKNDCINKKMLKPIRLKIIKDNLFDKQPSKYFLTAIDTKNEKTKSCIKKKRTKNVSVSCDADERLHFYKSKERDFYERDLSTSHNLSNQQMPKLRQLRTASDTLLSKTFSDHFLKAVSYDSEKNKYERLDNECNCDHRLFNHNIVLFGQCCECVPVQSKSYTDRRHRKQSTSISKARMRRLNISKIASKTIKKRVNFAEDIRIFSYDPKDSVLETYYAYNEANGKEQNDEEKEITMVSGEVLTVRKRNVANKKCKETTSKAPRILSKVEEKSTEIGDISTKPKMAHSENKEITSGNKESLPEVKEPLYYDNLAYMDDYTSSYSFETDLIDDARTISEDHENLISEKTPLINHKAKPFSKRNSELTRHIENKAKWIKDTGSMYFKRVNLKRMKSISKK